MFRPLAVTGAVLLLVPCVRAVTVDVPTTRKATAKTAVTTHSKTVAAKHVVAAPKPTPVPVDPSHCAIISVKEQKMVLVQNGAKVATYPVSTSKFGLGDSLGRMTTPLGYMAVAQKIGDNAPSGAVLHNRRFTGEVLPPNAPGRDPIISRIIWLRGLEAQNAHAFDRCIYIHGTTEEKYIGRPASYGCIRMKSTDVISLYNQLPLGGLVLITQDKLPNLPKVPKMAAPAVAPAPPAKNAAAPVLVATRGRNGA